MLTLDRPPAADLRPLRAHTTGDVVVPGERVWGEVLAALGLDGREPAAVVFPANDYDVAAVRSFVRFVGLHTVEAPDGAPAGDLRGTVVVVPAGTPPPWRFRS